MCMFFLFQKRSLLPARHPVFNIIYIILLYIFNILLPRDVRYVRISGFWPSTSWGERGVRPFLPPRKGGRMRAPLSPGAGRRLPPAKWRRERSSWRRPEFGPLDPSMGGLAEGPGSSRQTAPLPNNTWTEVAARSATGCRRSRLTSPRG